jgi:DNA-binding transcriptional MerR regulator
VLAILALRPASAEELARDLNVSVDAIQGYLQELEEERTIERVEAEHSGAPSTWRFRSVLRLFETEEWTRLGEEKRKEVSAEVVALVERDIAQSIESGAFDRRMDRHLTRTPFAVDEQGWSELLAVHRAAAIASQEIRMKSAKRLKKSGEEAITGRSVQALFELPED